MSFDGVGPIRIGMTEEEARAALGPELNWPENPEEGCDYGGIRGVSPKLFFLISDGRIARVDVHAQDVTTAAGARIGDSEDRIHQLYGAAVQVEPHAYADGHYLIIPAPGDTTRRLIFETNADTVTSFRAGVRPAVDWIEGCS